MESKANSSARSLGGWAMLADFSGLLLKASAAGLAVSVVVGAVVAARRQSRRVAPGAANAGPAGSCGPVAGAGRLPRGVPTRAASFRDAARFLLAPVPSPLARSFLDRAGAASQAPYRRAAPSPRSSGPRMVSRAYCSPGPLRRC